MIKGKILTSKRNIPLAGVHIWLRDQTDSTRHYIVETDQNGRFSISNIRRGGRYELEATYIGYTKLTRLFAVDQSVVDLGDLLMSQSAIPMEEVLVESRPPVAEQKGDTTEYTAKAFKTHPDASAEDLITKMPGVTVQNNTVKAQGEEVQQVLVDGRQFFGSDPMVALRNLPAEVIDKVQVFDKLSDQAQLTGFNDGQTIKTMNLVTREDRRQGQFGRFSGGYGSDDRYTASGNVNSFSGNQRVSVIGLSNNVNQQNFSMQDLFGVVSSNQRGGFGGGGMPGGRPRSGGSGDGGMRGEPGGGPPMGGGGVSNFLVGQQSGISSAHSIGTNYVDSLGGKIEAAGSYFFNLTDNTNPQTSNRQYTLATDSTSLYSQISDAEQKNYNHRINLRMETQLDSLNSFIITPQFYVQDYRSTSTSTATTFLSSGSILSQATSGKSSNTDGNTFQSHALYRHRFGTPGRTISLDAGISSNQRKSPSDLKSLNTYYSGSTVTMDTADQKSDVSSKSYSLSSNLMYTEPIGTMSLFQVSYAPSYTRSISNNWTYSLDPATGEYTILDEDLSNSYESRYSTHDIAAGYRLRGGKYNAMAGASYQIATLDGTQSFPQSSTTKKTFFAFLPNAMFGYDFSRRQNLRIIYRASTTSPSLSQLQNVVDNSNTLLLSTGNPDLRQSYTHSVQGRLMLVNNQTARNLMIFFNLSTTHDYIGNSTFIASRDTIALGGIHLNPGTQLTMPVNLNGYWSVRTFCAYGLPAEFLQSNLNLNAGISYTRTPGLVNGVLNSSNAYALSPGFVLGSNISEDVDFTLSYTANFNIARNSVQTDLDNNYYTHNAGLRFNWIFWDGFVFRNEMNNTLYSGLTAGLNQNAIIWNTSIGKRFLDNQRGELLLTVYDLLNQNKSINRNVTETYIEDTTTRVLTRYVMLTFTYNLRQFQGMRSDL